MKSIIKAIFSSIVAILSKLAKFFMSIPSWLVSLFKAIGSFFMICLLWVKRLLLSGWSFTKSLFAKARSIRKPSWFQWNIFPKDGQPPTQSLFEIVIYLICLWFCVDLFIDFNRIPNSYIILEADKLNDSRFIRIDSVDYSFINIKHERFTMFFQVANFEVNIPMNTYQTPNNQQESDVTAVIYQTYWLPSYIHDERNDGRLKLDTDFCPYWYCVNDKAAQNSNLHIDDYMEHSNSFYDEIDEIQTLYNEVNDNSNDILHELNECKEMLPDTLSSEMKQFYHIKLYSNVIDNNSNYVKPDTSWTNIIDNTSFLDTILYDDQNKELFNCYRYYSLTNGSEQIDSLFFYYSELFHSSNYSDEMINDYLQLCKDSGIDENFIRSERASKKNGVSVSFIENNDIWKKKISTGIPSLFDRYDISQGWYSFFLNTSTLDSINLTINFGGATDFYPMKIEPDEIGSNYIKYTDQVKLLKIRAEGLKFYAKFKEMENKQTIRCFAVTALISGLIIIILTFFILGLYRTLKVFGNYLFKNRNVQ